MHLSNDATSPTVPTDESSVVALTCAHKLRSVHLQSSKSYRFTIFSTIYVSVVRYYCVDPTGNHQAAKMAIVPT